MDTQTRVYAKQKRTRRFKQFMERLIMWAFAMIGALVILNWAMDVFKEGYQFYTKPIVIENSIGAVVKAGAHVESEAAFSVNSEREQEETQAPLPLDIDEVIDRIGLIESNNGQTGHAKTCAEKGLSNNYGYNLPTCFASDKEAREAVEWQLKKYADEGYDLEKSLRIYNTGNPEGDTDYVAKFNSLI
jgi:hypothetical protein